MDYNDEELENEELEESLESPLDELPNENEPVQDELASSDSIHLDGDLKDVKAKAKKNDVQKLTAKHVVVIVIAIVTIVLIFGILLFIYDFDFVGTGDKKTKYYTNEVLQNCNQIYLTWEDPAYTKKRLKEDEDYQKITDASLIDLEEEDRDGLKRYKYEEYDYDTFISGVVWLDNYNAKDLDNEEVYKAMAIANRSYLVSSLPNNCVILKEFDDQGQKFGEFQNYKENGTTEKYDEIMTAVSLTQGMILVRNNKSIPTKYNTFNYVRKRKEEDSSYNNAFFYQMEQENIEEQQFISASWVEELEKEKGVTIPKQKVSQTKKMETMGLYGAKYLLEKIDNPYDLYRVLKYYYGYDIEYYTIDYNSMLNSYGGSFASGCMWWPVGSLETTIENGVEMANGNPQTTRITSGFGIRISPTAGASTNHQAIDIGGGLGGVTNIIATADGKVISTNKGCVAGNSSCGGGLGNYVYIDHGNGIVTRYGHMYSVSVNIGDSVKQGQVIGKMGTTGTSTGVHLDFQVIVNGTKVNPLNYVSASSPRTLCIFPIGGITGGYTGTTNKEFIEFISKYAVEDMHSSGILASITIAQAILESNWGASSLSAKYNNFFGMKAGSSWKGQTVSLPTTECNGNDCYKTTASWRVYTYPIDSIKDHSNLLHANRYNGVVGETDYKTAITIIKNGGYATDPNYINKIINIIEANNLTQYDRM